MGSQVITACDITWLCGRHKQIQFLKLTAQHFSGNKSFKTPHKHMHTESGCTLFVGVINGS